ncbi:MAG: hypothetical protein ACRC33_15895 [Gemmataceae bacterium]
MRSASVSFAVWGLVALSAAGQEPGGRVNRVEIYNGATRTVRYNAPGLSPGESQSLRELERLENEAHFLREVDALKREYVASERSLEPVRRSVQRSLYGTDTTTTSLSGFATGSDYPTVVGSFGAYPAYPYRGFASAGTFGDRTTTNRSLENGVGDEGVLKAALARTIAQQATAEHAAAVSRAHELAVARASSPALRVAMGIPAEGRAARADGIRPVADDSSPVTLTLKGGETVRGVRVEEKGAWFTVTLAGGRQMRVRESEVVRIETAPGGVKPASD